MAYDPLHSAKNREASEYGGVAGLVAPEALGHTVLTPQEKRMLIQQEIVASAGVMEDLPPGDANFQAVLDLAARRKAIFASGHTLGEALQ